MPLWYDAPSVTGRGPEYRGSLVSLKPGTRYRVRLSLSKVGSAELEASTWPENFPVADAAALPRRLSKTLAVDQGGSEAGYRLFQPAGESTVIDVKGKAEVCVEVTASWVILRGLTLR